MKILISVLLAMAALAGCVNPFMADPARAAREADQAKIAQLDARLAKAQEAMDALLKSPASAQQAEAAGALAEAVKAMQAERAATQAHKDGLPKAGVDVDGILGVAEPLAGVLGVGWILALIKAGRKAKATYQERLEASDSYVTSAVAGVEDFAAELPPELKQKLYEYMKKAAKEHSVNELAMAEQVAVTKIRLRRNAA